MLLFRAGLIDKPEGKTIDEPHLGVTFDYYFMGQNDENYVTVKMVDLLTCTRIYDHKEQMFQRKEAVSIKRSEVKTHIENRIKNHLKDMGVDPVMIRGLMRDFEVDNIKCKPFDISDFKAFD